MKTQYHNGLPIVEVRQGVTDNTTMDEGFFSIIKTEIENPATGKKTQSFALAELMCLNGKLFFQVVEKEREWLVDWMPLTEELHQAFIDNSEGFIIEQSTCEKIHFISYSRLLAL